MGARRVDSEKDNWVLRGKGAAEQPASSAGILTGFCGGRGQLDIASELLGDIGGQRDSGAESLAGVRGERKGETADRGQGTGGALLKPA